MKRQHLTRRIVLSAAVVGLAVLTALGGGDSVKAEAIASGDHGSSEAFKKKCETLEGSYIDSPQDGLTLCAYPTGVVEVCDLQGNKCVIYPPKQQEETSWADPVLDATSGATITDDTPTVAPVGASTDAPLVPVTEIPVEAPMESQVISPAESGTLAAPVEAPVTLTEAPVAAEAPLVAEASAEQP